MTSAPDPRALLVRRGRRAGDARPGHVHPLRALPHRLSHVPRRSRSSPTRRAGASGSCAGSPRAAIEPDDTLVMHLDNCLDCRACETVCPAGVPYGRMLEATRGQIERRVRRPSVLRALAGWVLSEVLPHRERVHAVADLLRLGQIGPLGAWMRGAGRALAARMGAPRPATTPAARAARPASARARGGTRCPPGRACARTRRASRSRPPAGRAGASRLHETCVMEAMFPDTHREAVRLLVIAGLEVVAPRAATCCGALHAHSGRREEARDLARRNVRAFEGDFDFVVSHSAGCGAALRETGHLLEDDPRTRSVRASRARRLRGARRTTACPRPRAPLASPRDAVAAAARRHARPVSPRARAAGARGAAAAAARAARREAGGAARQRLVLRQRRRLQPHAPARWRTPSSRTSSTASRGSTPDVVIASNPGCLLHMPRGARERGMEVRIAHLLDVLGRGVSAAGGRRRTHA